jgi:hypothetical protein
VSQSSPYIGKALAALSDGLPCQAIKHLIPHRDDEDALHLLAEAYYLRGQNGAAMTALSYLTISDIALEGCILGRQGVLPNICEMRGYYAAEIAYARGEYELAAKTYLRIDSGPYTERAKARLLLIDLLTGSNYTQGKLLETNAWNLLENAERAKHSGDLELSKCLYRQAWNYYSAMPVQRSHAALGIADIARVQGDRIGFSSWTDEAQLGYENHRWGQETLSLLRSSKQLREQGYRRQDPLKFSFPL